MAVKINSIIVDDEPGNIVTLQELIKLSCPLVNVLATAANAATAFESINNFKPDLVFLDIEMPYGNAFDLLEKLSPVKFEIIFVTAFNGYAVKAFKYAALDYILKPVNIAELKQAVAKAEKRLQEKTENIRVKTLLANLKMPAENNPKISLATESGFHFEELRHILYLEASGSYTFVFTKQDKKYIISKGLKEFEEILPENMFCRIHHSYIINLACIKKYNKGRGGMVEMENGVCIDVAVRKKEQFLEKFKAAR
jgi:two-component system, LytTR family, response regulator